MNKFFLEQGSTRVHKKVPQASEVLQPYFKEGRGYSRLRRGVLTRFAFEEFFSYELFNSLSAKSVLAGEKLVATYSIST